MGSYSGLPCLNQPALLQLHLSPYNELVFIVSEIDTLHHFTLLISYTLFSLNYTSLCFVVFTLFSGHSFLVGFRAFLEKIIEPPRLRNWNKNPNFQHLSLLINQKTNDSKHFLELEKETQLKPHKLREKERDYNKQKKKTQTCFHQNEEVWKGTSPARWELPKYIKPAQEQAPSQSAKRNPRYKQQNIQSWIKQETEKEAIEITSIHSLEALRTLPPRS